MGLVYKAGHLLAGKLTALKTVCFLPSNVQKVKLIRRNTRVKHEARSLLTYFIYCFYHGWLKIKACAELHV